MHHIFGGTTLLHVDLHLCICLDTFIQSELNSKSTFELQEGFVVMVSSMSDVAVIKCHKPAGVSWFRRPHFLCISLLFSFIL